MKTDLRHTALAIAAIGICLSLSLSAQAKGAHKAKGAKLKAAPTSTYANGQTAAQREKSEEARLRRECQGRPNAGACLGYTR